MTNAIEQAKRGYAQAMHDMTHHASGCGPSTVERLRALEDATEEYLELLRQDHEALHETARKRFEDVQALEVANQKLQHCNEIQRETNEILRSRLAKMTEERDSIQLRLHAVDHAYNEQQSKAGTCGQVRADRGASEQADAYMTVVVAAVRGAQDIMVEYLVPDGIRAKRAMTKLIPLLDNEKLYSALYELEHEKA